MKLFLKYLKQAAILSAALLILCSVIYPLAVNGVSQLFISKQANGSMIEVNGKTVGSELIGQQFTEAKYFRGRVSSVNYNTYTKEDTVADAEGNVAYGGVASGSFNYGATNPALTERVEKDLQDFLDAHPGVKAEDVPADLLTASGSGLDPHISVQSARIQVSAVSEASGISEDDLEKIIKENTEQKVFGVFGEEKVNVLKCNIAIAEQTGVL